MGENASSSLATMSSKVCDNGDSRDNDRGSWRELPRLPNNGGIYLQQH
jgi:hypothetical protein